ncbi:anthocyanidin reductase ((2S)-flavan-3-ol-forming)-like [Hibiscus syriacus]|uniref:anthocyanidin reductase ((2S)-flavan-3-ol-forming)-like n=1 Tax=Hibiscus syriacus TaxID=106335 RepID=UPI0019246C1C|nr:anthocyanidin reductase ((2S)-flavan-3-ol-forming)-like [Hibiscus syriacus]
MASQMVGTKKACVVGGTGFVASLLIKLLLEKGYAVNTTVRDPDNQKKIPHLVTLQKLGDLKIFQADLIDERSFDYPFAGCKLVFQVATPVNFASQDPENDMIKPAIQGVLNVLKACAKAKTIKRVVLTSSPAAVSINTLNRTDLVMTERDWTDTEFLSSAKPPTWGYPASKTLAEKTAWRYAEENNIDLVTVIPSLMTGPSLTPDVPSSIELATALISGNDFLVNALKAMQMLSGSISITHVEDVCRAHVFLAEQESASGRYICCAVNSSVPELAKFLHKRNPEFQVPTDFGDCPSKAKLIISSEKLINEGFSFKFGIEEIFDQTVEYLKDKGLLK